MLHKLGIEKEFSFMYCKIILKKIHSLFSTSVKNFQTLVVQGSKISIKLSDRIKN